MLTVETSSQTYTRYAANVTIGGFENQHPLPGSDGYFRRIACTVKKMSASTGGKTSRSSVAWSRPDHLKGSKVTISDLPTVYTCDPSRRQSIMKGTVIEYIRITTARHRGARQPSKITFVSRKANLPAQTSQRGAYSLTFLTGYHEMLSPTLDTLKGWKIRLTDLKSADPNSSARYSSSSFFVQCPFTRQVNFQDHNSSKVIHGDLEWRETDETINGPLTYFHAESKLTSLFARSIERLTLFAEPQTTRKSSKNATVTKTPRSQKTTQRNEGRSTSKHGTRRSSTRKLDKKDGRKSRKIKF